MDKLKTYTDNRGSLTIVEEGCEVPFKIQRAYWIHGVPQGEERGKHSNKVSSEYVIAVSGSVEITLEVNIIPKASGRFFIFTPRTTSPPMM